MNGRNPPKSDQLSSGLGLSWTAQGSLDLRRKCVCVYVEKVTTTLVVLMAQDLWQQLQDVDEGDDEGVREEACARRVLRRR